MKTDTINLKGYPIQVYSLNTVIVGSGAAGFNAADCLYTLGQKDIAIVTEGVNMGTSRNTGSDKQTYYKLTLSGDEADSVMEMAKTLFNGGSRHGDIALIEAALSARCFYKLVDIGVPFPHNRYGEYVGYKTDHDPRQRATSAGPLTSRIMTEKLEAQVRQKGVIIFDGYLVIGILTDIQDGDPCAVGLVALNVNELDSGSRGLTLFNCRNIIYATGGPAGIYQASVYPESQTGASGIAFEAGARGANLTESQYGIASVKFRWNLSGTYQQVIPTYISTNYDGSDEREFLEDNFNNPGKMLDAIFLKGYQWPFDTRKIADYGSSLIDILVYNETQIKGRKVFMDFRRNPAWASKNGELDYRLLGSEAFEYLKNSNALFGTPIERLLKMNSPAVELYRNHGIDLTKEPLEIAVCAQHNNGGLLGNVWWESNLRRFFPVGEVNGSFGVYRPGGSALNSTQVGSLRAAQYICANGEKDIFDVNLFINKVQNQAEKYIERIDRLAAGEGSTSNVKDIFDRIRGRMTKIGAYIRDRKSVRTGIEETRKDLKSLDEGFLITGELPDAFRIRDMLITQLVYLEAIREYIDKGGKSRGSYLITDPDGVLPLEGLSEMFRYSLDDEALMNQLCEVCLDVSGGEYQCKFQWKAVSPIPDEETWFENVWNSFIRGEVII